MGEFPNKETQFKKGQSGNPNGQPKKSFSLLNEQLKNEGYEHFTRSQCLEALSLIFNLDEAKIKEIATDKTQPLPLRLIIKEMTNPETGGKFIQWMIIYLFGQATQPVDLTSKGNELKTITLFELPKNGRDEGT